MKIKKMWDGKINVEDIVMELAGKQTKVNPVLWTKQKNN